MHEPRIQIHPILFIRKTIGSFFLSTESSLSFFSCMIRVCGRMVGSGRGVWISLVCSPGHMVCRLKLYIHEHVHVLFWFYSPLCLVPAWILEPKPQLGRRGYKMIASYTGETHPLQQNVPCGLQFNASCSKFYFWQERCQSKGEAREEERSKREKKKVKQKDRNKIWGERCS